MKPSFEGYKAKLLFRGSNTIHLALAGEVLNNNSTDQQVFASELLPLGGYQRKLRPILTDGSFNTTKGQWEFPTENLVLDGFTSTLDVDSAFWIYNGSNVNASAVTPTPATGILTFGGSHNLVENERIMLVGSVGATAPTGTTLEIFYYASVVTTTEIRLKPSSGGTPITSFSNIGSGAFYIRYCKGEIMQIEPQSPPLALYSGQSYTFQSDLREGIPL